MRRPPRPQAARQLAVLADLPPEESCTDDLEMAVALVQHHDAITGAPAAATLLSAGRGRHRVLRCLGASKAGGVPWRLRSRPRRPGPIAHLLHPPPPPARAGTEKQAVANDYHRLLHKGWVQAAGVVNRALLRLMFPGDEPAPSLRASKQLGSADEVAASRRRLAAAIDEQQQQQPEQQQQQQAAAGAGAPPAILLDQCPLLNASICEATMAASAQRAPFLLLAYNPLAQPRSVHIRVPVAAGAVSYAVEGAPPPRRRWRW